MRLRERMYELTTPEEVKEFFEKFPNGAIFKAGGCHKTMEGFGHVEEALDPRHEIHVGFIRVIESRPASNLVAEKTGIKHESPQFILFKEGKPVFDVDNWDITPEVLGEALGHHLGVVAKQEYKAASSDIAPYKNLLERFVTGKIPEDEFEATWLETFQMDATPRSKDEFDALNSLFGNVDAALLQLGGKKPSVKQRASDLLELLGSLS